MRRARDGLGEQVGGHLIRRHVRETDLSGPYALADEVELEIDVLELGRVAGVAGDGLGAEVVVAELERTVRVAPEIAKEPNESDAFARRLAQRLELASTVDSATVGCMRRRRGRS